MAPLHDRVPVTLPREVEDRWLDPSETRTVYLLPLLQAYPAEAMAAYPVSRAVNDARGEGAGLIAPLGADEPAPRPPPRSLRVTGPPAAVRSARRPCPSVHSSMSSSSAKGENGFMRQQSAAARCPSVSTTTASRPVSRMT